MIVGYNYELRSGKRVVGSYHSMFPLLGTHLVVPEVSVLKQKYSQRLKEIKVPIGSALIGDNGVDYTVRRFLDVTKLSRRQRNILKGFE